MAGALDTYNAKRDFNRTPEPRGQVAKPSDNLRYLVQKHAASHLHYDFRLEIGGVLASWAVPKGPSLDPAEKRLAVRTEDHPLSYGDFEGTIPDGEYGGGTVLLWDQGTWKPEGNAADGLRKGSLKFRLNGKRLSGEFVLTRLRARNAAEKSENWLLIKRSDEAAEPGSKDAVVRDNTVSVVSQRDLKSIAAAKVKPGRAPKQKPASAPQRANLATLPRARKASLPPKLKPQLATLVEAAPDEGEWLSEIKFDGYRMLARLDGGKPELVSRNGLAWTEKLAEIAAAVAELPADEAWLDGEVVAMEADGRSDFSLLKAALSERRTGSLVFYLFDILHLDGYDLTECRQDDRKRVLHGLLGATPPARIRYSEHLEGVPDRIREQACGMRLEGIICKDAAAPYRQARSRSWLKLKCIQREEMIVLGFTDPRGSRSGFGALHVGYYDRDGALHYAGGVGTGFDQRTLDDLHERLTPLVRRIGPRVLIHGEGPPRGLHWVKPELVVELQYLDWTSDMSLRHAVFLGLRDDKAATEVVRDPPEGAVATTADVGGVVVHAAAPKPRKSAGKKRAAPADIPAVIDRRKAGEDGVVLTHPEKQLWPADGITKADLTAYWSAMAEVALPHIVGRPLALVRCPDGIEGETFFQKKASPGFPDAIRRVKLGKEEVLTIDDADGLAALAQMSAIEIHPWGASLDQVETPDRLIIDLDPDEGLAFQHVIEAAHMVRELLQGAGLQSFCKTTGGKGLHVVVPLRPTLEWPEAKAFCAALAKKLAKEHPRDFTATMAKAARRGRIFIDYLRNGRGATAVAAFSPRARPGAGVAMPVTWKEVKAGLDPKRFTLPALIKGPGKRANAWPGFFEIDQAVTAKARKLVGMTKGKE